MSKLFSKSIFWLFAFGFIFLLAMDFWWWDSEPGFLFGLPYWVIYFVLLQFILGAAIYFFNKFYWKE